MVRPTAEGLQNEIKIVLQKNPKGLSIEEVSNSLNISRTTAIKYLNAMEQAGMVEARPFGPAKIFSLSERVPIDSFVSLIPHLVIVLDEDLIIRQVNNALLDFFTIEKSSIIGREIKYSTLGSYINDNRITLLQDAVQGKAQSIEEDLTYEGVRYFFLIRIIPTILEHGIKGVVLILENITTLKKYQEHLEEIVDERTAELSEINAQLQKEIEKHQDVCNQLDISQRRYQQLIESSTDIILKYATDGNLIFHNHLAEEILGIKQSPKKKYHILGTCIPQKVKYKDYAETLIHEITSNPDVIKRDIFEYPLKKSVWISWTFHSIPSITSGELEILCIGTDVSDRMENEKRIKDSKTQMKRFLAHLPDPTFVLNAERKVVLWNQAMEEMTGVPSNQVVGKERAYFTPSIFGFARPVLADMVFEPNNPSINEYFSDLSIDREVLTAETKGFDKDGNEVIFWVKVTPVKDEKGQIIAAIQSLRDITSLKKRGDTLMAKEERARGILDNSKDLIVVINKQRNVVYSNSAYNQITKQNFESLNGKAIEDAHLPGNCDEWSCLVNIAIQTQLSNRVEIQAEVDGREIILDTYIIPFYPEHSDELQILIDMRDITALKINGAPLWDEEGTLQEIGKQVSKIIPHIKLKNSLSPLIISLVLLIASIGNYF